MAQAPKRKAVVAETPKGEPNPTVIETPKPTPDATDLGIVVVHN